MRFYFLDDEDEDVKEKIEEEDDRGIKLCLFLEKKNEGFFLIVECFVELFF